MAAREPSPKTEALRAMREAKFAKAPKVTAPKPKPVKKKGKSHGSALQAAD